MLAPDLCAAVVQLSRRERVTTFMTLLVAFQVVLHYRTGLLDVVIGTDVANRVRPEIEPLIGFFVNQLVLRGSSLATPSGHSRITYRNFFYPHHRWQFTGLRLTDYAG